MASDPARMASDPARIAFYPAERASDPAGIAMYPAGRALEPGGRLLGVTGCAKVLAIFCCHLLDTNKAVYMAYVAPRRPKSESITDGPTDGCADFSSVDRGGKLKLL